MSTDTITSILDAAEERIREGGYHAFSFRQIADQLGIKSASIHYHFPTKEKLGEAVARRYAQRFMEALGAPERPKALAHFAAAFRAAVETDGRSCLCGVLAAESGKLAPTINAVVIDFSNEALKWLEGALIAGGSSSEKAKEQAALWFYALEGAIHFSALTRSPAPIDAVEVALSA